MKTESDYVETYRVFWRIESETYGQNQVGAVVQVFSNF